MGDKRQRKNEKEKVKWGFDIQPTFGPVTARTGATPKNFGAKVLIPYSIAVTGYEFT